jgi:hypothetical protein
MEQLRSETPFARLVAEGLGDDFFTLLDVGCSGGLQPAWRVFGRRLRAFGFDPNLREIERLRASESLPGVRYEAAFVGLPEGHPDAERARANAFWDRNPWARLSTARTLALRASFLAEVDPTEKTRLNLWSEVPLADPDRPVVLSEFLIRHKITDVDFLKIDVDGADYLILRSLQPLIDEIRVLGIGIEVNFYGSDNPDVHTWHNVDRLMRRAGFDLFGLTIRTYSMAALPAPYTLSVPAQTIWGRPLQGDALYLRDGGAGDTSWLDAHKAAKLAALFSLFGLPDSAAETLVCYRSHLADVLDVNRGLDVLAAQAIGDCDGSKVSYPCYIAEFDADNPRFYPGRQEAATHTAATHPTGETPHAVHRSDGDFTAVQAELETLRDENASLHQQVEAIHRSTSWRLTAPIRLLGVYLRSWHVKA